MTHENIGWYLSKSSTISIYINSIPEHMAATSYGVFLEGTNQNLMLSMPMQQGHNTL